MAKLSGLTQEALDRLLTWLDPDREQAGKKYEQIRQSLVKIFIWQGCSDAEDLADETINRVARKVPEVSPGFVGDPALYFYGVGKKVLLESRKRPRPRVADRPDVISDALQEREKTIAAERRYECMEQCLQTLSETNRELIKSYYQRDLQAKIDSRKELARQLGIPAGTLRVRAHRLRAVLLECIRECLARGVE